MTTFQAVYDATASARGPKSGAHSDPENLALHSTTADDAAAVFR
jgi:hypothetical protein